MVISLAAVGCLLLCCSPVPVRQVEETTRRREDTRMLSNQRGLGWSGSWIYCILPKGAPARKWDKGPGERTRAETSQKASHLVPLGSPLLPSGGSQTARQKRPAICAAALAGRLPHLSDGAGRIRARRGGGGEVQRSFGGLHAPVRYNPYRRPDSRC